MTTAADMALYDVVVVGGGAAGVGISIALKHAGIENYLVLERHAVGASFAAWPDETCFITPSFPSNSIGILDLNSIAIGVSPAYSLEVEHPTGKEYAAHLRGVANFFELPIRESIDVERIVKDGNEFRVTTKLGTLRTKHVIWAVGEFQYPRLSGFVGSNLCRANTGPSPRHFKLSWIPNGIPKLETADRSWSLLALDLTKMPSRSRSRNACSQMRNTH